MKVMRRVMLGFVRTTELYSSVPGPRRSNCAHALACEQDDESTLMEKAGL
jgi:hypothetical protein